MFIRVREATVTLEDQDNFRAFKVVVEGRDAGLDKVRIALADLAMLPDRTTAWVAADALRQRPEVRDDAEWQQGFDAMIEKAKPFGWIDESGRSIKAHVEWVG
jgi:hypothetical protein